MKLTAKSYPRRYWSLWLTVILLLVLTACASVATPVEEAVAVVTSVEEAAPVTETASMTETATMTDTEMMTSTETMSDTTTMTDTTMMTDTGSLPTEMLGVIWQWQEGETADPSRYTLEFMADGNVAVQADCNRGRGTYQIVGQAFFMEILVLTRAACGPDSLDQRFLEQVNSTDSYRLEEGTLVLTLRVAPGMTTFTPADASAPAADGAMESTSPPLSAIEMQLADAAKSFVADETGVAAADLTVAAMEAVDWPDSSLGCPEPGMMYMQVITPGYRITLEDADGTTYEVHSAAQPDSQMMLCTDAAASASSELSGLLAGTVIYLQRIALPAGSVINVELQDVSRADAAAVVVASQTITTTGENVPIPFELTYDPAQIDPSLSYAVRAQILIDGEMRWSSTERYAVLTNGSPTTDVEVRVMPTN